jgi:dTDP-4-dehydrorhamnose reductase
MDMRLKTRVSGNRVGSMKILVTGANGQLGRELVKVLSAHHQVIGCTRNELDVTDLSKARDIVQEARPEIVVHTAAYTHVDQAEADQDRAFLVNAYGTRNMTVAAQQAGAKMMYISTDYVFDGRSTKPYREYDFVNPVNVYGKSKLAGEDMVKTLSDKYFIVRTSWVYGRHGSNFVKNMLRLAETRTEIDVVCDQVGSPTYAPELAWFIKELLESEKYGIYHVSNTGACSRYEWAKAIFAAAGLGVTVRPVDTAKFLLPAARPAYSVLDHMAIRLNGFSTLRHWRTALTQFIDELRSI